MNKIKASLIAVLTVVSGWIWLLFILVGVHFFLNVIDYITGLMAAKFRNQEISSYRSFKGAAKKICMWLLIAVALLMDILITFSANAVGIEIKLIFLIANGTTVWLSFSEVISILENVKDMGMEGKIPPFLKPIAKNIRNQIEDKFKTAGGKE